MEQISAFKKSVTGRVIPKSERERLEIFEQYAVRDAGTGGPADWTCGDRFYRNSVRMGKECEKGRRLLGQQRGK